MSRTRNLRKQFAGKFAVVTGGTQGLGEAAARLFAARGAAGVLVCGRNKARGKAVAKELTKVGCEGVFVEADLADLDAVRKVMAKADKAFGNVHILVNAAGFTDRGTILDTSPDLFDQMFAVNVRTPFFLIQDATKIMQREGTQDTIVNILSMSTHDGQPFICTYSDSKNALLTLTKNIAFSLMRDHIRVNLLNLGWMDTPAEHLVQRDVHGLGEDWLVRAEAEQPFGRLIKPEEAARTICYLLSDESGMMTGASLDFDQSVVGAGDSPKPAAGEVWP